VGGARGGDGRVTATERVLEVSFTSNVITVYCSDQSTLSAPGTRLEVCGAADTDVGGA